MLNGQLKSRIKVVHKPKQSYATVDTQDRLLRKKMAQCQQKSGLEGRTKE